MSSRKQKEFYMSGQEYRERQVRGEKFRPATIHETLGPLWKDIYWLVMYGGHKRPLVKIN